MGSPGANTLPKLPRIPELDALRGFFLVWMTLAHLPTHMSDLVNQPLGFVSSAEGFIFLSALLVGRIYSRRVRENSGNALRTLWKRSLKLYWYQVALLALAFTVTAAGALHTHSAALLNLLDFYMAHPGKAVVSSLFLIYCPPLLDILPMYIIFLALSGPILAFAARNGWRWILIVSGSIWLLAQFGLRSWFHHALVSATGLTLSINQMGAFNFFAWQALWVFAMWIGAKSSDRENPLGRLPGYALPFLCALCLFFVGVRHGWLGAHLTQQSFGMLLDKWQIGAVRAVNFTAFLFLIYWLGKSAFRRLILTEPFPVLGKASLEVFCFHLVFVLGGLMMLRDDAAQVHGIRAAALVLITFFCLILLAMAVGYRRRRQKERAAASSPAAASHTG